MLKRLVLAVLAFALCFCVPSSASETTVYTYTPSVDFALDWIRTQDAYMPSAFYLQGRGLLQPEDLFVHGGKLDIADTGNRRIIVYDPLTDEMTSFGEDILTQPTGLHVTDDGYVYVADYKNEAVYGFDENRNLVLEITRPDSYLFSEQAIYMPRKVAVSGKKTVYVIGEGATEGVMVFDESGEFQSYFGANLRDISPVERLQEIVSSELQKNRILTRRPRPVFNMDIDSRDLIYTVSHSPIDYFTGGDAMYNSIRKLNMGGMNILSSNDELGRIVDEETYSDIAINKHNCFIAITQNGVITEYNPKAEVLFSFGGRALSSERGGYFTKPVAVDVDENDFVYILDQERALVQVYFPTEFANATHRAVDAYESGDYAGSLKLWEDLLLLNNMSKIAHNGYGAALFALNRYDEALEEFAFTYNRTEYSDTYWEIRNVWITRYITQAVSVLIIGLLILYVLSIVNRRTKFITNFFARFKTKRTEGGLLSEVLYAAALMRHPLDAYYNLKTGRKGSVRAAVIIYALAFVVYVAYSLLTALLFRPYNNINTIPPMFIVTSFFVPLGVWVVGNYMVSTINDGEGSFRNVFVCTAYAFAPFIILMPFVVALSYALTLNESFIIDMANIFIIGWTVINFYLMVQEVHNFNFRNSIFNILLTLFAIAVSIIGLLIVYLMIRQATSFFADLYREVLFRAL